MSFIKTLTFNAATTPAGVPVAAHVSYDARAAGETILLTCTIATVSPSSILTKAGSNIDVVQLTLRPSAVPQAIFVTATIMVTPGVTSSASALIQVT